MYGSWGLGGLHKDDSRLLGGQVFSADFDQGSQDFDSNCIVPRFSAQDNLEMLELGQIKARNGFSTLKIGACHVVSLWNLPLLTQKPSCGVPQ